MSNIKSKKLSQIKLSVVGSALNEEVTIKKFIESSFKGIKKLGVKGEVVVVDDGSTDSTPKILKEMAKKDSRIKVITHKTRQGITESLSKAMKKSTGDMIFFGLTDMESIPEQDIPKTATLVIQGKFDYVIGSRGNKVRGNLAKAIVSIGFGHLSSFLFGIKIHDTGWVRTLTRECFNAMPPLELDWHRFMVFIAHMKGFRVKEIPLNYYPRSSSESRFGKLGFKRFPIAVYSLIYLRFFKKF